MKQFRELDLSSLEQFKPSDLMGNPISALERGKPMQVPLQQIDFDAQQPRKRIDEESIAELALSIEQHGVLEPVSLRNHPHTFGRYMVNRGERRVRAARHAGLVEVPAFLDERVDPYAQAAENLHREDMSPFDLATFIVQREAEGQSRAEIARRLNKSPSFITLAACLIDAPAAVRTAYETGRVGADTRALYSLTQAMKKKPLEAAALLASDEAITRARVDSILSPEVIEDGTPRSENVSGRPGKSRSPSAGRTVLVVEYAGRRGSLRLKAYDSAVAEVRFGDGTRDVIDLKDLRLVCWATEE